MKKYIDYYTTKPKNGHWFKRKLFGWGWTPVTWQGWLATIGYVALIFIFAASVDENSSVREYFFTFILPFILLTITFFRILHIKAPEPKWTWGLPKDDE